MIYLAVLSALAVVLGTQAINVHDFPKTSFTCKDKNAGEYYADLELGCQVYHICAVGQFNRLTKMSFACPNGTLFSQSSRICNSEDRVFCPLAERYYDNVQGTIDTQDEYKTVFQVEAQPHFPLEPPRRRRPAQQQEDDYDEDTSTQAPRRPASRRPPPRPSTTAAPTVPPRQRPPVRQFQPQSPAPQQPQFEPPQIDFNRPPAGGFLPPRQSRPAGPPRPQGPQGLQPGPIQYVTPQRAAAPTPDQFLPPPPPPPAPAAPRVPAPTSQAPSSQTPPPQAPNRLVVSRPNARRPAPLGAAPTTTSTTAAPTTTDPNAEYEYYDYEEPADGQQPAGQ